VWLCGGEEGGLHRSFVEATWLVFGRSVVVKDSHEADVQVWRLSGGWFCWSIAGDRRVVWRGCCEVLFEVV